jgi:hypothetical protein
MVGVGVKRPPTDRGYGRGSRQRSEERIMPIRKAGAATQNVTAPGE